MHKVPIVLFLALFSLSCMAKNIGYDSSKDPFVQLEEAAQLAKKENKLVLIISGGDWCRWCHVLDDYLNSNKNIYEDLKETFVIMKVYLGDENYNEEFFSQLPEAIGAPHFWVASSEMKIIHSQETSVFEQGRNSYSASSFNKFIKYFNKYKSNNVRKIDPNNKKAGAT
jgi:hypothetical protein